MPYSPLQLAQAFIQTGEIEDALDALNEHLDTTPDDTEGRRLRAQVLARIPGETALRKALADLDALSEQTAHDYILRSALWEKLGRGAESLEAAARGHQTHPEDERLIERYLYVLRTQGDFAGARKLAARIC